MNASAFVGFISAVFIFGTGITAMTLILNVVFPSFVRRAVNTAGQMPFRSAIVGFINFAFFSILAFVLFGMAQEAEKSNITGAVILLRLIGALELVGLFTFLAFGVATIARWLGERIFPQGSAARTSVSGVLTLQLAAFTPFVGWFLVPLSVILVGYGAVIIALVWRRNA